MTKSIDRPYKRLGLCLSVVMGGTFVAGAALAQTAPPPPSNSEASKEAAAEQSKEAKEASEREKAKQKDEQAKKDTGSSGSAGSQGSPQSDRTKQADRAQGDQAKGDQAKGDQAKRARDSGEQAKDARPPADPRAQDSPQSDRAEGSRGSERRTERRNPAGSGQDRTQDQRSNQPDANAPRDRAEPAQDANRNTRRSTDSAAGTARDSDRAAAGASRDGARSATQSSRQRTDAAVTTERAGTATADAQAEFNVQDVRPADIGLWFEGASATRTAEASGLVISDVATSGAIARFGFESGDRIVSVNGQRVTRDVDFVNYLFAEDVRNERVEVVVVRDDREEVILVEPALLIQEYTTVVEDPLEEVGIVLDDRHADRAVVWKVTRRSPAFYAGVRAGDVIVGVNEHRVRTPEDLVRAVSEVQDEQLVFQVSRGEQTRDIKVEVVDAPRARVQVEANTQRDEAAAAVAVPANPRVQRNEVQVERNEVQIRPNNGGEREGIRPLLPRRRQQQ